MFLLAFINVHVNGSSNLDDHLGGDLECNRFNSFGAFFPYFNIKSKSNIDKRRIKDYIVINI